MKTTFLLILSIVLSNTLFGQTQLNGVTFGFGTGYSILTNTPYSYSLSTDTCKNLNTQALSKGAFVISSVVSVKLRKMGVDDNDKLVSYDASGSAKNNIEWYERFSINASLNLAEISNSEVSFNKSIEGGIGLGWFLSDNVQIAAFVDITTKRQLRDYIIKDYQGKPIPNETSYYNALDEDDNNLFYNKTFTGFSLKVILSIGNKKPTS